MKNQIKRKRAIKWLNKISKALPVKTYQCAHKLFSPKYQDAEGQLWAENDEEKTRRMVWRWVGTHERNQKRMCLHIYDRFGLPGIIYYFKANGLDLVQGAPGTTGEGQIEEIINEQGDSLL